VILDERIVISTPEGVDLEASLAGLGTRFMAILVDLTVLALLFVVLVAITSAAAAGSKDAAVIVIVIGLFFIIFSYDVVCETFNHGRTPGKAALGIRVIQVDGNPVGFFTSAVRNVLRIVEVIALPIIAATSMVVTPRRQRIGDLMANTVVVRDRVQRVGAPHALLPSAYAVDAPFLSWDVSAVSSRDLAVVRRFLERRRDLIPAARWTIGNQLGDRIRARVTGIPPHWQAESVLEGVVAAKAARDRR
jgi:uncharacterized RDD family membrane protein YckC